MTTKQFFSALLFATLVFTLTNCRNNGDDPPPPPFENSLLNMVRVEGGTFYFGAGLQDGINPANSGGTAEGTATTVSTFWLSTAPVTQAQYEYVMGVNPSWFQVSNNADFAHANASSRPVEQVTWFEAIAFANKLSLMENREPVYRVEGMTNADWRTITHADVATRVSANRAAWDAVTQNLNANGFRLPTEAEWEFAARGGVRSESAQGRGRDFFFSNGNNGNNVWHWENPNTNGRTHPVRHFSPNALGLYDMSGNVWEWTWNWWGTGNYGGTNPVGSATGSFRVLRGGGWGGGAVNARVSNRSNDTPTFRFHDVVGFRLASSSVQ